MVIFWKENVIFFFTVWLGMLLYNSVEENLGSIIFKASAMMAQSPKDSTNDCIYL